MDAGRITCDTSPVTIVRGAETMAMASPQAALGDSDRIEYSYGRLLWACLVLAAFNVPFESATSIPLVGSVPRLLGGLTIAVFVAALAIRRRCFTVSLFSRVLFLHVTFAALSLAWVVADADSQRRLALLIQLSLLATLVVQVARTHRERAVLASAYGLGTVVAAMLVIANRVRHVTYLDQELGLGQAVSRFNVGHVARYTVGIEDPNYIGMVLVVGIPTLIWGLSRLYGRSGLIAAVVLSAPVAFSALLTGSRGSTVVAPMFPIVYIIVSSARRHLGRMVPALGFAGLIASVVWRQLPADTQFRVRSGFDSSQSTSRLREVVWRAGYHAFLRRPIQGYGLGSYQFVVRKEIGRNLVAHNTFINLLVEFGVIGASLFVAVVIGIWRKSRLLPHPERLYVRSLLLLFAGCASFISADLKKVTFFVLALLVAHVTNRGGANDQPRTRHEAAMSPRGRLREPRLGRA